MLALLFASALAQSSEPHELPWKGYTLSGLQERRNPWQLNWNEPEREWLLITTDSQQGRWFIQLSSDVKLHSQPKENRRFWLKIDYSHVKVERARDAKALYVVNCEEETFTVPSMTWYLPNGLQDGATRSYPTSAIIPESVAATIAKRVCTQ